MSSPFSTITSSENPNYSSFKPVEDVRRTTVLFSEQCIRTLSAQCNNRSTTTPASNAWSSDSVPGDKKHTHVDSGGTGRATMVPIRSDMAIWYSTVKGSPSTIPSSLPRRPFSCLDYVSWRSPDNGSIFIQSLITVFARTAYRYDLAHMVACVRPLCYGSFGIAFALLLQVNRTMDDKFAAHESTPFQTPCFESHLRHVRAMLNLRPSSDTRLRFQDLYFNPGCCNESR